MKPKKAKTKLDKVLELKVYKNKRTGQALVMLPKKKFLKVPEKVKISW
jgi:hypothetical protein